MKKPFLMFDADRGLWNIFINKHLITDYVTPLEFADLLEQQDANITFKRYVTYSEYEQSGMSVVKNRVLLFSVYVDEARIVIAPEIYLLNAIKHLLLKIVNK